MRIARLLLQAFGPFTDTVLDFEAAPSDLHLVYGPNEAGKSSALRAMTDLRFGIPLRSNDHFVHPTQQLRIAGIFLDGEGTPLALARRKGKGRTLARLDAETLAPSDLPVTEEQEFALTGGLERADFEMLFGIDHARLRSGGARLLGGEGELGSTLFEASAGTRGIGALLAQLDADAKRLYNPHGGSRNATINDARRKLDEQRQLWKQAQTRPAEWQQLNRTHESERARLEELTAQLEQLRRLENELTELRTVEPLLRAHDIAVENLAALAQAPDLPEDSRERRLAAEQRARAAREAQEEHQRERERCTRALGALVVETEVLVHAAAIERLAGGIEAAHRSRIAVRQESLTVGQLTEVLAREAGRIAQGCTAEAALAALPSAAERVVIDDRIAAVGRLRERCEQQRRGLRALDAALAPAAKPEAIPAARQVEAVAAALAGARALGDVAATQGDLERKLRDLRPGLDRLLAELGGESVEALARARPLLQAAIAEARDLQTRLEGELLRLRGEAQRLAQDLEAQQLRRRQLAAEGEVVTGETLRLARARRDEGWALVRRRYVERIEVDQTGLASAGGVPEAFEEAQAEADRQADLLRADARRAAAFEECAARIEQMQERQAGIAAECARIEARAEGERAVWRVQLAAAGLPELLPDALREWQGRRQELLERAERVRGLESEAAQLADVAAARGELLSRALRDAGFDPAAAAGFTALLAAAEQWHGRAVAALGEERARVAGEGARRREREQLVVELSAAEAELAACGEVLAQWHSRLFLAEEATADAIKARLDELEALARMAHALAEARQRRGHHEAVVEQLAAQATQLAGLLGDAPPDAIEDYADRLRERLKQARAQEQLRQTLVRELARAEEGSGRAGAELAAVAAELGRLMANAGVECVESLPEREEQAARRRATRARLEQLRDQLAAASSRSLETLHGALAGRDAASLELERARCRDEIARIEQLQGEARRGEEAARRALEAVDTSDAAAAAREAMEAAAARYRSALRPWARLRFAQALLLAALGRFRERAQAPMVATASEYFALMTGGRYPRLTADDAEERPVLRAERDDGATIGVDEMSEGTADQLYLALRLAALELRRASHPPMPLLLDDVLVTSDDTRAAHILRALARFAQGGQVMLFTHHRHLLEVARAALGETGFAAHRLGAGGPGVAV